MEVGDSKPPVKEKDPAGHSSGKAKSVSSSRPKTSTQRLDNILDDDLRNFGSLSSRLSTPSSSEGGDQPLTRRGTNHLRGLQGSSAHTGDQRGRVITVGNNTEERGRATLLQQKNDNMGYNMSRRDVESRTKVDSFLEQEQDELAMSLSQSKFLMLRNANLERVKAGDRDRSPDLDELKQLEKIKSKFNLSNLTDTEEIPETVPDDVFQDIPDDVFEKIPRAVTARIQNRKKGSSARTQTGKQSDLTTFSQSHPAPSAPSAPQAEAEDPSQPVGFIAMLFSGGSLARPGNNVQQIEQDFMFALFLQNKEDEARDGNQSGQKSRAERDPDQGHFCAPDMPGFCEANFCIFHSKK